MKLSQLKNKKVALWGFGLEGKSSLSYLQNQMPELPLTVICPEGEADLSMRPVVFNHQKVNADLLSQYEVVIKSPGISPYQDAVGLSTAKFSSATELWFDNEREKVGAKVIAVTGTKGKSTTAAMLTHVLTGLGLDVVLAGNFGVPILEQTKPCDYIVLETSSYQAQDGAIKADIGVLLNLYSEHLDWHKTEQQYHTDKCRLINDAQLAILNAKDENTKVMQLSEHHGNVSYFADQQSYYVLNNTLMYKDKALFSQYAWSLKGRHNLLNAAAVCQVVNVLGLNIMACINHIKTFKSLPHRLQDLGQFKGVNTINDSISSTPKSAIAAIDTVDIANTILLLGGFDRGLDWQCFVDHIKQNNLQLKYIICSGQNGEKIHNLLKATLVNQTIDYTAELKDAVYLACQLSKPGDTLLLSPGAPSFDGFANYQQRGVQFESWIKQYFMS